MKSDIETTDQDILLTTRGDIEEAQRLFSAARAGFFTLIICLDIIEAREGWRHLGYSSFREACKEELNLSMQDAYRGRLISKAARMIEPEFTDSAGGIIRQNGFIDINKADFTDKMRNFFSTAEKIGYGKAAELSEAIIREKIDWKRLLRGEEIDSPAGGKVSLDTIHSLSRNEIRGWLSESNDTPASREPNRKVEKKDPVAEYHNHLHRAVNAIRHTRDQYFALKITQNIFDAGKEKRRELEDILDHFRNSILSIDSHTLSDQDLIPAGLKETDFLPAADIASFTGKAERSVQHLASTGKIKTGYLRSQKSGGRTEYRIHPDGLPDDYKNLYYAELTRRAQEDEAQGKLLRKKEREKIRGLLTPEQWRKAINIEFCIENFGHLKGEELNLALKAHNEKNTDDKPVTYKSFMRHLKNYAKDGIKGIADMRGLHRKGETKVNQGDYEYFRDAFLTENKKSAQQCWEEVFGKAKREGRITHYDGQAYEMNPETGEILGSFPVEATFSRLLDRRVPEATQVELREGIHRFKQSIHFNHVNITRETIAPGEIYVMDHHTFDVLCKPSDKKVVTDLMNKILYHNLSDSEKKDMENTLKRLLKSGLSGKKHVRLWLTNCIDYRTHKQLAWYLHEDAPNSDHVMMTFKWACQEHGYPDVLMMDNGKDFLAYDFAGNPYRREKAYDEVKINNLMSYIPTQPHFVLPREGQAKPIERQYRQIINQYAKQWPTYTGPNPAKRPESTSAAVAAGKMPTAIEVIEKFDDFVINTLNRKAQGGKALAGKSPDQVWDELHPGKRMPTKKALELMTMRNSQPRQLYGNGFKMPLMGGHFYWGDWMQGLSSTKEKYYAKWDPYEWDEIFIFRGRDHKPMGKAYLEKMSPAWAKNEDERKKVADAIATKKAAIKRRRTPARQIRKIAAGDSLENLAAYVEHENEIYDAVHELREDGTRPIRLVQSGLDDLARSMEDSFENRQKKKSEKDLSRLVPASTKKKEFKNPLDDVDISDVFD